MMPTAGGEACAGAATRMVPDEPTTSSSSESTRSMICGAVESGGTDADDDEVIVIVDVVVADDDEDEAGIGSARLRAAAVRTARLGANTKDDTSDAALAFRGTIGDGAVTFKGAGAVAPVDDDGLEEEEVEDDDEDDDEDENGEASCLLMAKAKSRSGSLSSSASSARPPREANADAAGKAVQPTASARLAASAAVNSGSTSRSPPWDPQPSAGAAVPVAGWRCRVGIAPWPSSPSAKVASMGRLERVSNKRRARCDCAARMAHGFPQETEHFSPSS